MKAKTFKFKIKEPKILKIKAFCTFGGNQTNGASVKMSTPRKPNFWDKFLMWINRIYDTSFEISKEIGDEDND